MTDPRDRNVPRDGEPMLNGAHDYATWDAAYVLGSLSDADRHAFEAHLVGCAPCQQSVTELTAVSPLLSLLDYDQVMAGDGADRVGRRTAVP